VGAAEIRRRCLRAWSTARLCWSAGRTTCRRGRGRCATPSGNRDNLTLDLFFCTEIYLMNPDGANPRRLTTKTAVAGGQTDRLRQQPEQGRAGARNTSDLFVMKSDGKAATAAHARQFCELPGPLRPIPDPSA
jgi:hypothetical protein